MKDQILTMWAQLGILTTDRHEAILRKFGDLEKAWHEITPSFLRELRLSQESANAVYAIKQNMSFEQIQDIVQSFTVKIYYIEDDDYPETLKNMGKPPPFLFVRGVLPDFHKSIAVVGTRTHSDYGRNVTRKFTADLVRSGFVVVSGLALGIDSIAHATTLEEGGTTVAVLGSGVDQIYPSSNHRLGHEILQHGGAIVSTFPLGTRPLSHHFPQRNYIVAGLTRGTLVIEGGDKSGALITADLANKGGRAVFSVPCNISRLALSGTNKIIRNGEAKLVENVDHILEDFGMDPTFMVQPKDFTDDERLILEKLSLGAKTMDMLFEETTFDIPQLAIILTQLMLKGAVDREGARYALI